MARIGAWFCPLIDWTASEACVFLVLLYAQFYQDCFSWHLRYDYCFNYDFWMKFNRRLLCSSVLRFATVLFLTNWRLLSAQRMGEGSSKVRLHSASLWRNGKYTNTVGFLTLPYDSTCKDFVAANPHSHSSLSSNGIFASWDRLNFYSPKWHQCPSWHSEPLFYPGLLSLSPLPLAETPRPGQNKEWTWHSLCFRLWAYHGARRSFGHLWEAW